MSSSQGNPIKTSLTFRQKGSAKEYCKVTFEGAQNFGDPKKVLQLMDVLQLPEGTEAEVLATASTVIVR